MIVKSSTRALALGFGVWFWAFAVFGVQANAASVYGLVVGIDDYIGTKQDLTGAVNDANDIAQALHKIGAAKVILLTDAKANKHAIKTSWYGLVKLAKPGDTIIFSYAGHGAQEPEPPGRHDEKDGLNENFLLAGFTPKGPGRMERIVDDEVFEWLKAADTKGIQVIFVADSCHSGSMHRSAKATGVKFRNGKFGKIEIDEDLLANFPPPAIAKMTEEDLKNVTFIAATQEDKLTPEVDIDGKPRGALSWAFARALEGAADTDKDGRLTQVELVRYLVPAIHQRVEAQQTPEVRPFRPRTRALMTLGPPSAKKVIHPKTVKIKLAIVDAQGPHLSAISGIGFVTLVATPGEADLVWHPSSGHVEHKLGGRVASEINAGNVHAVLAKWATLKLLREHAIPTPVEIALTAGNQRYAMGSIVKLRMSGAGLPYLTMFNIAPNGRVEFFAPSRPGEANKKWQGQVLNEQFKVERPPYGAEHIVAIFTKDKRPGLHSVLKAMSSASKSVKLPELLAEFLDPGTYQLGIAGVYTGEGE